MLKIALCDSNKNCIRRYAQLISKITEKHNILFELSYFYTGESLLFQYIDIHEQFDIIYIDANLKGINGMETVKTIREYDNNVQIIFLTDSNHYVYDAFDVNASQYLIKENTTEERFEEVFLRTVNLCTKNKYDLFSFEFDGNLNILPLNDISFFEVWKRIITVNYQNKTSKFYDSLDQLELKLGQKNFIRVHRSYLVNMSFISSFNQQNIVLKTSKIIPIGVTYVHDLKTAFNEYINKFQIYKFR